MSATGLKAPKAERQKNVFSTNDVAQICNVAPRTVCKWFDTKMLHGFRIPGSKDRRIPYDNLVRFMKEHKIPLHGLAMGTIKVLIIEQKKMVIEVLKTLFKDEHYTIEVATNAFTAGFIAATLRPHVILIDLELPDINVIDIVKYIKENDSLLMTKIISMFPRGQAIPNTKKFFFDGFVQKFPDATSLKQVIDDAMMCVD